MLSDLLTPAINDDKSFTLPASEVYGAPPDGSIGLDSYINTLPLYDTADVVGLHENILKNIFLHNI